MFSNGHSSQKCVYFFSFKLLVTDLCSDLIRDLMKQICWIPCYRLLPLSVKHCNCFLKMSVNKKRCKTVFVSVQSPSANQVKVPLALHHNPWQPCWPINPLQTTTVKTASPMLGSHPFVLWHFWWPMWG